MAPECIYRPNKDEVKENLYFTALLDDPFAIETAQHRITDELGVH
jgi:hypothetical protein